MCALVLLDLWLNPGLHIERLFTVLPLLELTSKLNDVNYDFEQLLHRRRRVLQKCHG